MTFGQRFKMLRNKKCMTQEELLKDFNSKYYHSFGKSAISQYENNKRIPEIEALKNFAEYFDVSIDYLLGKSDIPKPEDIITSIDNTEVNYISNFESTTKTQKVRDFYLQRIPLLGYIDIKKPIPHGQEVKDHIYIPIEDNLDNYFGALVKDNIVVESEGENIVIVKGQVKLDNGQVGLILIDNMQIEIRKIYINHNMGVLLDINSNQPPLIINLSKFKILGRVIKIISNV